jgi:hypothetical protein
MNPANAEYVALDTDAFRIFTLQDLDAALELRYEYEDDENRRPRREGDNLDPDVNWKQKRNLFEERFTIDTTGAVYHKNFLEFTAESTVGLRQEDRYGDFDDDEDETLWEYDVNPINFPAGLIRMFFRQRRWIPRVMVPSSSTLMIFFLRVYSY